MPTPLEILLDPVSMSIIGMYALLMAWEAMFPARQLPEVPFWRIRGIIAFFFFFFLSSYLPLWYADWLPSAQFIDLTQMNVVIAATLGILLYELGVYVWHRSMHKSNILWRVFHQMHHSAERLDTYGAFFFSPLDMTGFTVLGSVCFSFIMGLPPQAITITLLVSNFFNIFQHANIKTPKWLGHIVQRPESHTVHHARGIHAYNYSDLPLFDIIFRTFRNPEEYVEETGFYNGASSRLGEMLKFRDVSVEKKQLKKKGSMKKKSSIFKHSYYLTDGGLETTLIFHSGVSLNCFAAFELLRNEAGKEALKEYYVPYLRLAEQYNLGFVLESPTWRASSEWGLRLGYTHDEMFALNKQSLKFIRDLAQPFSDALPQIIFSGNIGPGGDGYKVENRMSAEHAKAYHLDQVKAFALADADIVTAVTINYSHEAVGIINAARSVHLPVVISFSVETDGKLPSGESLQDAIENTDKDTNAYAEHFMINCAHPQHFLGALQADEEWKLRIRGIRANASTKSHAELDESETLDTGDKCLLSEGYSQLFQLLPELRIIGGCCGTDHTHLEEICKALEKNFVSETVK